MRTRLIPYHAASASARDLARTMGIFRLKKEGSSFRARPSDVIINWGNTTLTPRYWRVLNLARHVANASDKVTCLSMLEGRLDHLAVPPFTTSIDAAREWFATDEGCVVVCRTLTRASSGRGIVMAPLPDMIVPAPLYTKYIKKISEYRVHVVGNAVIDVQKKMRRTDIPDEQVNWQVRSHSNGFIFGREGVVLPDAVTADCVRCVNELGLDFGAVDVIFNAHQETYYVLEVNTAPGLTGTTLVNYANALTNLANS